MSKGEEEEPFVLYLLYVGGKPVIDQFHNRNCSVKKPKSALKLP